MTIKIGVFELFIECNNRDVLIVIDVKFIFQLSIFGAEKLLFLYLH